jgi:hypothetical protein
LNFHADADVVQVQVIAGIAVEWLADFMTSLFCLLPLNFRTGLTLPPSRCASFNPVPYAARVRLKQAGKLEPFFGARLRLDLVEAVADARETFAVAKGTFGMIWVNLWEHGRSPLVLPAAGRRGVGQPHP